MLETSSSDLWKTEYEQQGIPSSIRADPSGSLISCLNFLKTTSGSMSKALDVGCGTGRNSLFLAQQGFDVTSLDFVSEQIEKLSLSAKELSVENSINALCHDVGKPWPVQDNFYDLAIDTFCFKHQISVKSIQNYLAEIVRCLKKDGYYLLTLADRSDGYYRQFAVPEHSGHRMVILDPGNNILSVLYRFDEVISLFSPWFKLKYYEQKEKNGEMYGISYMRSTHLFVFQKAVG